MAKTTIRTLSAEDSARIPCNGNRFADEAAHTQAAVVHQVEPDAGGLFFYYYCAPCSDALVENCTRLYGEGANFIRERG